jgi:hypothetical protein
MLGLTHVNPDWLSALSVALVRPAGEPERRHGQDPWERQGEAPRARAASPTTSRGCAWPSATPSCTACTRFRTGGRSRPGFPTTTRSNGCAGSATARSSRPPASASPKTKPPTPDKQRKIATSGIGSARARGLVAYVGARARARRSGLRSRGIERWREPRLRTRCERLEAGSTRASSGRSPSVSARRRRSIQACFAIRRAGRRGCSPLVEVRHYERHLNARYPVDSRFTTRSR